MALREENETSKAQLASVNEVMNTTLNETKKLKQEKEGMNEQIATLQNDGIFKNEQINKLKQEIDIGSEKIEQERKNVSKLEDQIKDYKSRLLRWRKIIIN